MMKWKTEQQAYGPSREVLYLGAYHVATVSYDITSNRDDDRKHAAVVHLPGHKTQPTRFKDVESAKQAASDAVTNWISKAGLQVRAVEEGNDEKA